MFGNTPLHFAAISSNVEVVSALLSKGGLPSTMNMYGTSALHQAVEKADVDVVEVMIECEHVNINLANVYGYTPLHLAAIEGNVRMTELLVSKGANKKAKNTVSLSP